MPLWAHQSLIKTNTTMTEITALRNGKICYHSVEPRLLTEAQVKADLRAMYANSEDYTIIIQYSHGK